jgi:predicted nucleic acid-binding protein
VAGSRKEERLSSRRLVLDSGAVIALSRGESRARAYLARARELLVPVEIPVVVVAETIRGGPRDAPVHRVLKAVGAVPLADERHGRTAGRLLGTARSTSTADALVVAQAIEGGGAVVLTGDPEDLGRLAAGHPDVWIERL